MKRTIKRVIVNFEKLKMEKMTSPSIVFQIDNYIQDWEFRLY